MEFMTIKVSDPPKPGYRLQEDDMELLHGIDRHKMYSTISVLNLYRFKIIKDSWNKTDKRDARNMAKALWVFIVTGDCHSRAPAVVYLLWEGRGLP